MDLALVAHLAAIEASVPFLHFFDGFRTSHEVQKIEVIDYDDMARLVNREKLAEFRRKAMNPEHPELRGTAQNPDIYFQGRERANPWYLAVPSIVSASMEKVGAADRRRYRLFDYVGHPRGGPGHYRHGFGLRDNRGGRQASRLHRREARPGEGAALPPLRCAGASQRYPRLCQQRSPSSTGRRSPVHWASRSTPMSALPYVERGGTIPELYAGRYGLGSKEFRPVHVQASSTT